MIIRATKFGQFLSVSSYIRNFCSLTSVLSLQHLEEALSHAIQSKSYQQIPELLNSAKDHSRNPNLFSFLSKFPNDTRTQIVDEILQSFISIRPRSRPQIAYSCLLSHTLQSPDPFPLALAILQRTLRSGCIPDPLAKACFSKAWIEHGRQSNSIADILLGMKSIGYSPDTGTCNYVISSLCAANELDEAIRVLKSMTKAGCIPDSDSFGTVIGLLCRIRRSNEALEMLKTMVKAGTMPRQGTALKVAASLRANREAAKGVELVELLEREDSTLGFEVYELVTESCLECHEYVLAGKIVMKMTARGFIPYIQVRQRVVEGLASLGESTLVHAIRERFRQLGS